MPVAARIVGDDGVPTCLVLTAHNVATESRGAAALDRVHDIQLRMAHMAVVGAPPSEAMIAEDVRDFQSWTGHGRLRRRVFAPSEWGELIERAHHLTQHFAGDVRIARRGVELRMSQSHLDKSAVTTLLRQSGG